MKDKYVFQPSQKLRRRSLGIKGARYRLGNQAVAVLKFSLNGFQATVNNMHQLSHRSTNYQHLTLACFEESFLHGNNDLVVLHRNNGREKQRFTKSAITDL